MQTNVISYLYSFLIFALTNCLCEMLQLKYSVAVNWRSCGARVFCALDDARKLSWRQRHFQADALIFQRHRPRSRTTIFNLWTNHTTCKPVVQALLYEMKDCDCSCVYDAQHAPQSCFRFAFIQFLFLVHSPSVVKVDDRIVHFWSYHKPYVSFHFPIYPGYVTLRIPILFRFCRYRWHLFLLL